MENNNDDKIMDEALKVIFFNRAPNFSDELIERELTIMKVSSDVIEMSSEKVSAMMNGLKSSLTTKSLGQIVTEKLDSLNIGLEQLSKESSLSIEVLQVLQKDEIYTNNIPIVLLKGLLFKLQVTFKDAEKSILKTFQILEGRIGNYKDDSVAIQSFRKGMYQSKEAMGTLARKTEGKELFENQSALDKYLDRLKELMN
jgi:hypothetical protein